LRVLDAYGVRYGLRRATALVFMALVVRYWDWAIPCRPEEE
jgi:hypothetical protein